MTKIGNYGSFFAFFPTPKIPKDQNLEKIKKIAEDIIILHNCTNRGTVPEIWREKDLIFLSFWDTFFLYTPLTMEKIKILKQWKKFLEMSSLHTCIPKITII